VQQERLTWHLLPCYLEAKPRVAEFGPKLGRAVTEGVDEDREFDAPPDSILDRVQFLSTTLRRLTLKRRHKNFDMLDPQYFTGLVIFWS
jgi:hypothetical protein